ncbi:hypothetical protein B7494_g7334 [Chlorociboria aeruginascens]|nr:hypothetical protein B7494_g7334 [Chlorociboria aeruginascens]
MSISDLINSINAASQSVAQLQERDRIALLTACETLKSKLETSREAVLRQCFAPHHSIALRLAIDMGLFDAAAHISTAGDEITIEKLVLNMNTKPDSLLIIRVMRFLVGMGLFLELGPGIFKSTSVAAAYVTQSPLAQAIVHMTFQNEVIASLPSYFAASGYQTPGDAYDGPFQAFYHTKLHCFDWIATNPKQQHAFNVVMGISRSGHGQKWFEYFPVSSKLQVKSPSDTLLVDIGGGIGHDLIAFQKYHPGVRGKLVVQEIPVVVDSITDLPTDISAMKHNFFSCQPIKEAKAYYLANVLHDWPDKQSLVILGHIKDAMSKDSILLVNENVLPELGVTLFSASTDFVMMSIFSALERTEKQYKKLFAEAGLELVGVWKGDDIVETNGRRLLEVVLKR